MTSVAVALAGVILAWLSYSNGALSPGRFIAAFPAIHNLVARKYYIDELYQWVIDQIILAFGRFVALFDRIVINDAGVDGPAVSVKLSALRLRYIQSGRMYNYGFAMIGGVVALALVWWLTVG